MSGGSLDYVYYRVDEVADAVLARAENPLQRAFGLHLKKVALALHDLEWAWSGDFGEGQEEEAIKAVVSPADVLETSVKSAEQARDELNAVLKEVKS